MSSRRIAFPLCLLFLIISPTVHADTLSPVLGGDARIVLADLLSVDTRFPGDATRTETGDDGLGRRFRLEFESDDGARVNGMLAMPADDSAPVRLAIALHPMGMDQSIWWSKENPIFGSRVTEHLRRQGFAVLTLDARLHGERKVENLGPREIIGFAHGDNPRPYARMIADSVRDYRLALRWADRQADLDTGSVFVLGYSMGAQMSLLLASVEPRVTSVLAMVPPYVESPLSTVAPRQHVGRIESAEVRLLVARNDPYSTVDQNQQLFDAIASPAKDIRFFDSKHVLPEAYLTDALAFIDAQTTGARP
jgi:dienelactone hydrolase